jgi:hypothetical protein
VQKVEAGRLKVLGQPGLHNEILSQKQTPPPPPNHNEIPLTTTKVTRIKKTDKCHKDVTKSESSDPARGECQTFGH